jgi:LMBR1 domain-containing protein 1
LGVYLVVFLTTLFKTPKFDQEQIDRDLEEDEEEGLLASTGRRFGATWQDITGRARKNNYGTADTNGERT